jgi:hypothetical protein
MSEETITQTSIDNFYKLLLHFYPKNYRQRYGEQMLYAFQDLYQEALAKSGKIGLGFWLSTFTDTLQSVFREHLNMIKQVGIKKYFRISNYNILGGILLLPFFLLFGLDFTDRIIQGDLFHYNRQFSSSISHTILYANFNGQVPLLWTILVAMPILAVLINLIPLFFSVSKKIPLKKIFTTNSIAIILILAGLFCLVVVYGHDVIPCTFHSLLNGQGIPETLSYCKNA